MFSRCFCHSAGNSFHKMHKRDSYGMTKRDKKRDPSVYQEVAFFTINYNLYAITYQRQSSATHNYPPSKNKSLRANH